MSAHEALACTLAGKPVTVCWGPFAPHVDLLTNEIRVPPPPADLDEEALTLVRAFLDHESAHVRFSDGEALAGLDPETRVALNAIEDGRVNRLMGAIFPGCAMNLEGAHEIFLDRVVRGERAAGLPDPVLALAALARVAEGRPLCSAVAKLEAGGNAVVGRLLEAVSDLLPRLENLVSTADARNCALEIVARWRALPDASLEGLADARIGLDSMVLGGGGDAGSVVSDGPRPAAKGLPRWWGRPLAPSLEKALRALLLRRLGARSAEGDAGEYSPKTGDDLVLTVGTEQNPATAGLLGEMRQRVGALLESLSALLRGEERIRVGRQRSGTRLDTRSLHRIPIGDGRLFRRIRVEDGMSAALSLLLDFSGSMRGKVRVAVQVAAALAEAADLAGAPVEVLGFTTWGSLRVPADPNDLIHTRCVPLRHLVIKPFEQPVRRCEHAFANVIDRTRMCENIDGEAVLWAAGRLAARTEDRRILCVISDGRPAGAVCIPGNQALLERHLREAVQGLEADGIECIGIGVQSQDVERFYPASVVVKDVEDLAGDAFRFLERILVDGGR